MKNEASIAAPDQPAAAPAAPGDAAAGRAFLFLQGPHGPFFKLLARALKAEGARVLKAGINRADEREWGGVGPYRPFTGDAADWPDWVEALIVERGVTDLALYGDTRPHHAAAKAVAKAHGVRVHCFEEGYLRPYWITYERGGANGHSRLMDLTVERMAAAVEGVDIAEREAPPIWGAAWRHAAHGFRYHFDVLFRNGAYPGFRPHRPTSAWAELGFYFKRMSVLPLLIPQARRRQRRLFASGASYHLALLQMSVDASMRDHSDYADVGAFIDDVTAAFASGAPPGDHLVFKTHPFEDGRERLEARARAAARAHGVEDRMWFLQGGKLGALLDRARSAVTVNSTAGQQALWRGLPLAAAGVSVYAKPEFVSTGPLAAHFAEPMAPDAAGYRAYRRFLLASSQVEGSYYTLRGRRSAIEAVIEKLLAEADPYEAILSDFLNRISRQGGGRIAVFQQQVAS